MGLPLFIREYIVIAGFIGIGTFTFYVFFKDAAFLKWGRLAFLIITAAYFSRNFFLFAFILFGLVQVFVPKRPTIARISYYLLILPLLPSDIFRDIPFPGLERLFALTYPRMLSLFILLPIFFSFFIRTKKTIFTQPLDKYVLLFFIYIFIMGFRDTTLTNAFRWGFNWFLDFFIIYFVISRVVEEMDDFERLFKAMLFTASILALIAIFETFKRWHVFSSLAYSLGAGTGGLGGYAERLGLIRAFASFGEPITFGIYLASLVGGILFMRYFAQKREKISLNLLIGVFFIAIFCTISRGPLVFMAIFFFLFILLARQKLLKLMPTLIALAFILLFLPITNVTMSSLPFIGKKEQQSVDYRKMLWNNSLRVIKRSPLTGSNTYFEEPEMKELEWAGGKLAGGGVDVVNTYLAIALQYGMTGLALFGLVCLIALCNLWKSFFKISEEKTLILGKTLLSILGSFMVTLATVSMITLLPFYFWFFIGLSEGYANIVLKNQRGVSNV